jgi:serine/threonine protein kinase
MGLKEGTLQSLIERESHLPAFAADSILCQMLQALDYFAHSGIVHRDVKLENRLLNGDPTGARSIRAAFYAFLRVFMCFFNIFSD